MSNQKGVSTAKHAYLCSISRREHAELCNWNRRRGTGSRCRITEQRGGELGLILKVLRGCLAAYLFAVAITAFDGIVLRGQGVGAIWGLALAWLAVAVPFTFLAFPASIYLSARSARVSAWQVGVICALLSLLTTQTVGISVGASWNVVVALGLGALYGVAFWIGAFGLAQSVDFGAEGM